MECRIKWSNQHVHQVNNQWKLAVLVAENPQSSQPARVGALVIADRALEYLLEVICAGKDSTGEKVAALRYIIPGFKFFAKARDVRNRVIHEPRTVAQKELLMVLLEYQKVFRSLGIELQDLIGKDTIRKNGSPDLRKYLN